jgi:bisphosphoglycerate-dependent phosphoglycerate mutase
MYLTPRHGQPAKRFAVSALHPAWRALVRYCAELQHGEIERLKIQDGLPILAEVTKKKIKFVS